MVRLGRFRSGIAVGVLTGGLVGGLATVGALPALAATAARPGITVAAKSLFKPVTGDVFVVFDAGKFAKAQIHGSISGAARGEVVRLFAQPFPFKNAPARAGSATLASPSASYSFTVIPTLATRYRVALYPNSTSATALAATTIRTVYVADLQAAALTPKTCARPVCRESLRIEEVVPASTLRDEITKHWYFYFGLSLSPTKAPPPPKFLTLDTHATISAPVPGGARRYTRTISFSFRIGRDGYDWAWNECTRDTEATDGLGLPGHHGCGAPRISSSTVYLG